MSERPIAFGVGVFVAVAVFYTGLYWFLQDPPRINQRSANLLTPGMTLAEVQEILRAPPGRYCRSGRFYSQSGHEDRDKEQSLGWTYKRWEGDDGTILLAFDSRGRLCETQFYRSRKLLASSFLEFVQDLLTFSW
jgi:hypothetical protein